MQGACQLAFETKGAMLDARAGKFTPLVGYGELA